MPMVTRRLRDPDINPCLSESDASTRCMAENNYDKESCSSHFLKYKNCRKFWDPQALSLAASPPPMCEDVAPTEVGLPTWISILSSC
ncbi:coiled-coil-helix-coiled-coil-helix domain-containing protein 7 isoform X3 [Cervus elaphus]|uniref:coiled-coil-helix-coiled-coil-helix domain-containing protein 7 isoform X3 n=1 Tax=Cervus elaphus TaxID=9860 RepID=UPI001CC2F839|nr:coiled-coil-helix-coiled-coil-helix domain-containing protein 7 isoform X3 [Cervus elaphus]